MADLVRVARLEAEIEEFRKEVDRIEDVIFEKRWPKDDFISMRHEQNVLYRKIQGHKELIKFYSK